MGARTWLNGAMHAGFFLLLAASAGRLVARHEFTGLTVASLVICGLLAAGYAAGVAAWHRDGRWRLGWLAGVIVLWIGLAQLAPSFGWCAVPLYFLALRLLPMRWTVGVAAVLTVAAIAGQLRITQVMEPSLVLAPIGIAAMITVVFWALDREITARQRLIDDLIAARDSLAESQRRAGVLAERDRLSREIHDSIAQGLSSMGLLLQAAGRQWDTDPAAARDLVGRAERSAELNLAEARRFVRDLQPVRLAERTLPEALRELCAEIDRDRPVTVEFRVEGEPLPASPDAQAALLRVAQGALANVVEHSRADRAVVTLSYLDDGVTVDVFDDGVGFDVPRAAPGRGFGLSGMRARLAGVGGELTVESATGDGTTLAARVPLPGSDSGERV